MRGREIKTGISLNSIRWKGYLLAIISAASFGLIPLFVIPLKKEDFPMDTTLFYRFFFAAVVLVVFLRRRKEKLKLSPSEWLIFPILGFLHAAGADLLFVGYDLLTPGIASTIFFAYPVIVALVMWVVFKEMISLLTGISLGITFSGIYILSMGDSPWDIHFPGLFITLSSATCYALYIIFVNRANLNSSGLKTTFYSMVFASLYYLIKGIITGNDLTIPQAETFIHLILFALVTAVISVLTLTYAVRYIGPTPTSILGAFEPVVAVGVSVLLFGEEFSIRLITGILLILSGVIVCILSGRKRRTG